MKLRFNLKLVLGALVLAGLAACGGGGGGGSDCQFRRCQQWHIAPGGHRRANLRL